MVLPTSQSEKKVLRWEAALALIVLYRLNCFVSTIFKNVLFEELGYRIT